MLNERCTSTHMNEETLTSSISTNDPCGAFLVIVAMQDDPVRTFVNKVSRLLYFVHYTTMNMLRS
ncbi:hypothetical protein C8Q78DRAFT_1029549 [Trametes maxima]|nr:hypothetical protein C8Q78DRAFT_1029549 [Trametes maxima]